MDLFRVNMFIYLDFRGVWSHTQQYLRPDQTVRDHVVLRMEMGSTVCNASDLTPDLLV